MFSNRIDEKKLSGTNCSGINTENCKRVCPRHEYLLSGNMLNSNLLLNVLKVHLTS